MLEYLAHGITIIEAVKGLKDLHGLVTGHTLARRVDRLTNSVELQHGTIINLDSKIEALASNLYFLHQHELYKTTKSGIAIKEKKIITPSSEEISAFKKVHHDTLKTGSLVFSSLEELPRGFLAEFNTNPLNFLIYRQKLGAGSPPAEFLRDDTLVPIQFMHAGDAMVGFMKKGYVEHVFGLTYREALSEFTLSNLNNNPFENTAMRRNQRCYCNSGLRFKHCHGSFKNAIFE
jgi:hypothetical protein